MDFGMGLVLTILGSVIVVSFVVAGWAVSAYLSRRE